VKDYVLCCVSTQELNQSFLDEIKSVLQNFGAKTADFENLCENGLRAVEIHVSLPEEERVKIELLNLSNNYQIDMALIPHDDHRLNRKLIVFDMDSTLIQHEVIVEMAKVHGIGEQVKVITERAMNGELNFDEALRERVALLEGLKRKSMEEIMNHLKLSPGVEKLISVVKSRGYKTAIVSGGFKFFADNFKNKLGMDYAFANDLEWDKDVLTGKVKGEIINARRKAELIEELAQKENISLEQVVAVGDGANDLPMLAKAGLGIAYHAKEKVRKESKHQLSHGTMATLLYFLGIRGDHYETV
jgi:phosphoserine phosphatase